MTVPIPDLQSADLPDRTESFWKLTGPGAIMIGLALGSGELILWPWITAKFGTEMMWAAALGVFLQLFINIEVGRWAVATGESAFTGFARMSKFWVYFFMTLMLVGAFLPGMGRAVGTSLRILIFGIDGPGGDWLWTALVIVIALVILFGPKRIYTAVEKSIMAMVALIIGGVLFVAISVGTWNDVKEMLSGMLNVGTIHLDEEFTFHRFFGAFVFAGIGGLGNLFYAYYLRDKGIGMGKNIPALMNPLREAQRGNSETGFLYPDNEANARRFNDWFRFVQLDSIIFFWIANTVTMFLFMFGAFVVLFPAGIVPAESQIIWDLAQILESSMGQFGRYLFLIIGIAVFFSSVLAGLDGGIRLWVDLLHSNFKYPSRFAANRLYLCFAIGLGSLGVASTWLFETYDITVLDFFFIGAMLGGFAMAAYVPMLLYMNIRYLPKSAQPKLYNIVMVSIGGATYISFAVYTVWNKLSEWFL
ncbi:MAG: Nramp family divalent metal transporter [bacterium]|nr:hypothetical protein [Gammaproteobacteria bacterium]